MSEIGFTEEEMRTLIEPGGYSMLEVNHVNKSYGGKKALQDFSCVLEPGEIYGLLGRKRQR